MSETWIVFAPPLSQEMAPEAWRVTRAVADEARRARVEKFMLLLVEMVA